MYRRSLGDAGVLRRAAGRFFRAGRGPCTRASAVRNAIWVGPRSSTRRQLGSLRSRMGSRSSTGLATFYAACQIFTPIELLLGTSAGHHRCCLASISGVLSAMQLARRCRLPGQRKGGAGKRFLSCGPPRDEPSTDTGYRSAFVVPSRSGSACGERLRSMAESAL